MRYLVNLPLFIAFISLARVFDVMVLSNAPEGGDNAIGTAYEVVLETGLGWIMLGVALAICGAMGGFRWPRLAGGGGFMVGLVAYGVIVLVSLTAVGMAMETSAAAARWGYNQSLPRLVAFGMPLALVLYGGWIVNAPAAVRNSPAVHGLALGAVGLLCLIGVVVSVGESARENRATQAEAATADQATDERAIAQQREIEALSDSAPLIAWDAYVGDNLPESVRGAALRRIAGRPTLEDDLSEALANGNANWSAEALALIVKVPFTPSAGLAQPVREAIGAYADRLTQEAKIPDRDGDKRLDYYEGYKLGMILKVAERMAEGANVDLSDSIDAVARAVALYPRSDTAHAFPARVTAAKTRVAQILASRRG